MRRASFARYSSNVIALGDTINSFLFCFDLSSGERTADTADFVGEDFLVLAKILLAAAP